MPFSLSNTERLLWFDTWVSASTEGVEIPRAVEAIFSFKKDIDDTTKYLINTAPNWALAGPNEFVNTDGVIARVYYDHDAEQTINNFKND